MYEDLTPTTELEAVNAILEQIGEPPVSTLEDLALDAQSAWNTLQRVMREVQKRGWHWNTTYHKLTATSNGEFLVPENAVRVDTVDGDEQYDVILRGRKLFDKRPYKNTTVFEDKDEMKVSIISLIEFEEMPESARHYVYVRAARQNQEFSQGSTAISKFSEDDEMYALTDLIDEEVSTGDYNFLQQEYRSTARFPIGHRRY